MQHDRDAELIAAVTEAVCGIIRGVHLGDNPAVVGGLALLVNAIIEHRNASLTERPDDEALRRAVARLP